MFRRTTALLVKGNLNQQAKKATEHINAVRKRLEESRRMKDEQSQAQDPNAITDKLVLEAYKELDEERRAEKYGISVETLRFRERRNKSAREKARAEQDDD